MVGCFSSLLSNKVSSNDRQILSNFDEAIEKAAPPQYYSGDVYSAFSKDDQVRAQKEAIAEVKMLMEEQKVDMYLVSSDDNHLSEYVADSERRIRFLSGYTGHGDLIITKTINYLYVNPIYWIQADNEVCKDIWTIIRVGNKGQLPWSKDEKVILDGRFGFDPALSSSTTIQSLVDLGVNLKPISENLVDKVWGDAKPKRNTAPLFLHGIEFTGMDTKEKISNLLKSPEFSPKIVAPGVKQAPAGIFVPVLDEIAWLLNLRCIGDIPNTPVFYSFLWVSPSETVLFIDKVKINEEVQKYLDSLKIQVQNYDNALVYMRNLVSSETYKGQKILTPLSISYAVESTLGEATSKILSPITTARAIKNPVEVAGFRAAYLRDGRATVKWIGWLDEAIRKNGTKIDEFQAGEGLTRYRRAEKYFKGLAYDNISGSGPNGALPHYSPVKGKCRQVDTETPYVNDSGAQYLDATIDTTRTYHFGKPTDEQKDCFTRALKGHIALDSLIFPQGTAGAGMDAMIRKSLWDVGLNFGHGIGHGIGEYLSVHEGPQGVPLPYPFTVGHVISNEPGYYKEGEFGLRIESAIVCEKYTTEHQMGGDIWLHWSRLTRVPIQKDLVNFKLLSPEEKQWLKEHNQQCVDDLEPLLEGDDRAKKWLKTQTVGFWDR